MLLKHQKTQYKKTYYYQKLGIYYEKYQSTEKLKFNLEHLNLDFLKYSLIRNKTWIKKALHDLFE